MTLEDNRLTLHYWLGGKTEGIVWPQTSLHARRKDELWKATCFEFFLAIKGQTQYWEFNMSPSGDWNIYHMDAYRRVGFKEEERFPQLAFDFETDSSQISLNATVDLNPIASAGQILEAGITAMIQTMDGNETYWALVHPGPIADFHLRESFLLELAEQPHILRSARDNHG